MDDGYKCSILIIEDSVGLLNGYNVLLGDTFLRAYYSIYDFETMSIGLVRVPESRRAYIDETYALYVRNQLIGKILISLGSGIMVALILMMVVELCNKRRKSQEDNQIQEFTELQEVKNEDGKHTEI